MAAPTTVTERLAARGRRAHGISIRGCLHAIPDRHRLDQFPDAGDADVGGQLPPGAALAAESRVLAVWASAEAAGGGDQRVG
jgi:hypothetical protein